MSKKKKKNSHKLRTEKVLLVTAILNLISAALMVTARVLELMR